MASGRTMAMGYKRGIDPYKTYDRLRHSHQWSQCERCGSHFPEERLIEQDGQLKCRDNCAWPLGRDAKDKLDDRWRDRELRAEANTPEPINPRVSEMRGVPRIDSDNFPEVIALTVGGASVVVIFEGHYLSATDTLTFSGAAVNVVSKVYSGDGETLTLTVNSLGGSTPGNYDFIYNGDRYATLVTVRS